MNWLKTKVNQSTPPGILSRHSADLNHRNARLVQCNYIFSDDSVEKQINAYIADIKRIILNVDCGVLHISESEMIVSQNSIQAVCGDFRSMTSLIASKSLTFESVCDLMDILNAAEFAEIVLTWTKRCLQYNEFVDNLIEEQLSLYDMLISQSNQQFLTQKQHLRPLLQLLEVCSTKLQNDLNTSPSLEERFLQTLHQLCVGVTTISEVLDLLFDSSSAADKFPVFNLLIPFVHREGVIGQQARDASLLIMSLSAKHEKIGLFIANSSDFCLVLATGLSGLYSSLPCKLEYPSDDWHHLSDEDVSNIADLKMFLNSLEFCNAVMQASHPAVCDKLLEYIANGFLFPVIGPALNQSTIEEVVAATAYLDLFVRKITEPSLLKVFVEFVLFGKVDEMSILDLLITRISSQLTRLCVVTLTLFYTLVDLNCQDVMHHLVFKHVAPGRHIMLSQHRTVKEVDHYSSDAGKFLSMIPECCNFSQTDDASVAGSESSASSNNDERPSKFSRFNFKTKKSNSAFSPLSPLLKRNRPRPDAPPNTPDRAAVASTASEETSYGEYLTWAHHMILSCKEACQNWTCRYDATHPSLAPGKEILPGNVAAPDTDQKKVEPYDTAHLGNDLNHLAEGCKPTENQDDLGLFMSQLNESVQNCPEESSLPEILMEIDRLYDNVCQAKGKCVVIAKESSNTEEDPLHETEISFQRSGSFLLNSTEKPSLGPFLEAVFDRVERMVQSTLYVNLQLTSLIARLSCYPQPLLRSLILSHNLIFQPSIRSFQQVLSYVKKKLEDYLNKLPQREASLMQAYQFLMYRMGAEVPNMSFEVFTSKTNRRTSGFHEIFKTIQKQHVVVSHKSAQYIRRRSVPNKNEGERESVEKKNAIYASLIFREFLKELAAISQEHAIACLC